MSHTRGRFGVEGAICLPGGGARVRHDRRDALAARARARRRARRRRCPSPARRDAAAAARARRGPVGPARRPRRRRARRGAHRPAVRRACWSPRPPRTTACTPPTRRPSPTPRRRRRAMGMPGDGESLLGRPRARRARRALAVPLAFVLSLGVLALLFGRGDRSARRAPRPRLLALAASTLVVAAARRDRAGERRGEPGLPEVLRGAEDPAGPHRLGHQHRHRADPAADPAGEHDDDVDLQRQLSRADHPPADRRAHEADVHEQPARERGQPVRAPPRHAGARGRRRAPQPTTSSRPARAGPTPIPGIDNGAPERAAPQWYHDHRDMVTGRNVWMGMVGAFIYDDPFEQALDLPQGEYDVPLMVADREFDADNQIPYTFVSGGDVRRRDPRQRRRAAVLRGRRPALPLPALQHLQPARLHVRAQQRPGDDADRHRQRPAAGARLAHEHPARAGRARRRRRSTSPATSARRSCCRTPTRRSDRASATARSCSFASRRT